MKIMRRTDNLTGHSSEAGQRDRDYFMRPRSAARVTGEEIAASAETAGRNNEAELSEPVSHCALNRIEARSPAIAGRSADPKKRWSLSDM